MYKKINYLLFTIACWMVALAGSAQDSSGTKKVEMADRFRADGKIYVVIAVVLIILIGLFVYVTSLDRKIKKLEKEIK
jgi:CcmD family protein